MPFDRDGRGRPVLEGKQIEPFQGLHRRLPVPAARRRARQDRTQAAARMRDIASATNRVTLIAAIVPAEAVTTHTLFCLKTPLPLDAQHVLCALLNSFVANYLIRFRVNTHVTVALVSRLRVPPVDRDTRVYQRLSTLAQTLMHSPAAAEQQPEYAELQGLVGRLVRIVRGRLRACPVDVSVGARRGEVRGVNSIQQLSLTLRILMMTRHTAETRRRSFVLYGDAELNALSEEIIRCAIEVHRELGPGLLESAYETAMCIELKTAGIDVKRQIGIPLYYKGN